MIGHIVFEKNDSEHETTSRLFPDFYLWSYNKAIIYIEKAASLEELQHRIILMEYRSFVFKWYFFFFIDYTTFQHRFDTSCWPNRNHYLLDTAYRKRLIAEAKHRLSRRRTHLNTYLRLTQNNSWITLRGRRKLIRANHAIICQRTICHALKAPSQRYNRHISADTFTNC